MASVGAPRRARWASAAGGRSDSRARAVVRQRAVAPRRDRRYRTDAELIDPPKLSPDRAVAGRLSASFVRQTPGHRKSVARMSRASPTQRRTAISNLSIVGRAGVAHRTLPGAG